MRDDVDPRRSDARRNRERILGAGIELFRDASDVPMYEVAKRAGVGQATLYRHFPDRAALVEAICEVEFAGVLELSVAREADPGLLLDLLRELSGRIAGLRGLVEVIRSHPAEFAGRRRETEALLAGPLAAAQAAGDVRPDLEVSDVLSVLLMVEGATAGQADPDARARVTQRALALVVDGLRA